MAFILADRVKESTTSPGTGTATLLGAATGYQSFSAGIGANNTTYYVIADQNNGPNWEVGYGTIGAGGTTLARTTVLASSNSGSLVNFSSGTQDVWCDYPAKKAVLTDSSGFENFGGQSYLQLTPIAAPSYVESRVWYDSTAKGLAYYNDVSGVTIYPGQEVAQEVYNSTGSTINAGSVVYITGQHSQQPTIALAKADSLSTSNAIGVVQTNIANNSNGYITVLGFLGGLNTSGFTAGDTLYLSATTAGAITNVAPTSPNYAVRVGFCTYSNPSVGDIFVSVRNVYVNTNNMIGQVPVGNGGTGISTTPSNGQLLVGNGTNYTVASLGTGTGISTTTGSGTLQINNTGVTSAVAGTGISVSGSTGAVTISNTGVTSVSATAPVASSGGTTPTISMAAANGTTNGYLTSTDWNTFNNKGSGTVTSVSGTAPISSSGGATPAISISQATTSTNGYLSSTDWNTFNGKAPGVTYTTNYVPYGQGTTTPNQSSSFTFDGTVHTAPVMNASYGFHLNPTTIATSYTIPSGYNATTAGKVTINTGITVTVSTGSRWVVV